MNEVNQSLAETLKQILQSLQVRYIFPATLLVMTTLLLFWPEKININDLNQAVVIIITTIIISYVLNAFNGLIIRCAEGYEFKDNIFFKLTGKIEKRIHDKFYNRLELCDKKLSKIQIVRGDILLTQTLTNEKKDLLLNKLHDIETKWRSKKSLLYQKYSLRFPPNTNKHLPTAFGNTIAAFENYPYERYNIDAVYLWPHLLPILEEKKFSPFVQNQKTTLDFLLNTALVCIIVCFELLILLNIKSQNLIYLFIFIFLLFFSYLLYYAAVFVARDWGKMVCTAFDLYRNDLRLSLFLQDIPDNSLEDEKQLWRSISEFIIFGKSKSFKGFVYSKMPKQDTE